MHINYSGEIDNAKERLNQALGNLPQIVRILKEISESDTVDLLFYNESEELFYDKVKKNSIPIKFLQEDTRSMIGKAYLKKTPYYRSHTLYDKNYNISIDNPFKLNISSQIIIPVLENDLIIGIIRFSKYRYTFNSHTFKKLLELDSSFIKIFSQDVDKRISELNKSFFSIDGEEVYAILDSIKTGFDKLTMYVHNPEIKKLLYRADDNLDSICEYLNPTAYDEEHNEQEDIQSDNTMDDNISLRILIADDVEMNVRILNAMIKIDSSHDILFAYDGVETLTKIEEANRNKEHIHVLFLDHHMPGKLGLEVAEAIRSYEESDHPIRTIIVSITNDPDAIEEKKNLYDYHIPKPFVKSDIVEVMNQIQASHKLL
jgi:CheY-like chemotaxis protein